MSTFYEELDHTADWRIRVWGDDLNALFERAAAAMFELQGADLAAAPDRSVRVACQSDELETLLIAWLNELLYLSETDNILYTRFQVAIEQQNDAVRLTAGVQGVSGRGPLAHIKAATYWDLHIEQTPQGREATITFDT